MGNVTVPPDLDAERDGHHHDEEPPRLRLSRRGLVLLLVFVAASLAFLYWGVPQLAGLDDTWNRIERGEPTWLAAAFACTVLSFGGYVLVFRSVFSDATARLDVRASYQISMASLAATRLFAAGGAGGLALMAWALRRAGMSRRRVADATIAFLALTYLIYALAVIVCGLGLYLGLFAGASPLAVTLVPAIPFMIAFVIYLAIAAVPPDAADRLRRWAEDRGRLASASRRVASAPAALSPGVRQSLRHLRPSDPALWGAIAFWGFNVGVLWACFNAFGHAPPLAVVVMGYFVGMLGNLLPLPGGVGGVDGGMIGAFAALGVDFGLATVAVLTYRGFAFWLPTIPGAIAYFQLRKTVARWRAERGGSGLRQVAPAGARSVGAISRGYHLR